MKLPKEVIIGIVGLVIAICGCTASWMVVPEFRATLGLNKDSNPLPGDVATVVTTSTSNMTPNLPTPSSAPLLTPTDTLALKPTATMIVPPKPGDILYQADWSRGMDRWIGDPSWKVVGGMLINDGSTDRGLIKAPYNPGELNVADYAVEFEMKAVKKDFCGTFGAIARSTYLGGIYTECFDNSSHSHAFATSGVAWGGYDNPLLANPFYPSTDWHTYRMELQGMDVRLTVDGSEVGKAQDGTSLQGGEIELWTNSVQIAVRNFKVIALP